MRNVLAKHRSIEVTTVVLVVAGILTGVAAGIFAYYGVGGGLAYALATFPVVIVASVIAATWLLIRAGRVVAPARGKILALGALAAVGTGSLLLLAHYAATWDSRLLALAAAAQVAAISAYLMVVLWQAGDLAEA